MIKNIRALLVVCSVALLAACGGGGGSSDSTPSFAGRYHEVASVTANSCNLSGLTPVDGFDVVNQDGRNISIQSGGITVSGTVDADNGGFTTNGTVVVNGVTSQVKVTYRTNASGGTYTFQETVGVNACTVVYTGTATKV